MKRFFSLYILFVLLFASAISPVQAIDIVADFIVAKDGTGDFTTLQAAIDACPNNQHKTIGVKAGTYEEKVMIGSHSNTSSKLLSIIGEDAETVIITWNDYNGKTIVYDGKETKSGTPQSATFTVNAQDFQAENLTIQNTYTAAQAVALYNLGDRQTFKNCRILGFQDTHYLKKGRRYYFYNCYIEGGTDYICAGGTALFENCTLHSLKNNSFITAPEDITATVTANGKKYYYGFVFLNCRLTTANGIEVYLGRPWQGTSSSVFLHCTMENIKSQGWSIWSGTSNHLTSFFAEYNSLNPDGTPVNISNRVDWSVQLTQEEVETYYNRSAIFSLQTPVFNPFADVTSIDKIQNHPTIIDRGDLEIYTVAGQLVAKQYNAQLNSLNDSGIPSGIYIVRVINENGNVYAHKIIINP
jgi:pectinesterase